MNSRAALAAAIVLAATLIVFAPVRRAGFLQDDRPIVEINPIVQRGDLGEIFRTDYWGGVGGSETNLYRPVTIASFALERKITGRVAPGAAHLANVLLHALTSLVLGALILRLGAGTIAASIACILFAIHPIHVTVVAGLVGRAEILAALFTLAALLAQSAAGAWSPPGARATHPGPVLTRAAAWGAAAFVFLALGSKEVAFAAPVLLVVLELLFRPPPRSGFLRWGIDRAAALAPTALAVTTFLVLRTHALGVFPGTQRPRVSENPVAALEGVERVATALGIAGRGLRLLVFPHPLSADYSGNVLRTFGSPLAWLPLGGAIALGAAACLALLPFARRGSPQTAFGAWLFLLPYLAVGNLFVLVGIGFAERLLYLPSAGFCMLAGVAGAHLARRLPRVRPILAPLACLLALALCARTFRAAADSTSVEKIFESALRATPESPRANFTLGKIRQDQRRTEEALRLFDRTLQVWPHYSAAWFEKGTIQAQRGDRAAAARSMREAVRANPWLDEGWRRLGDLLLDLDRAAEAASAYERALRLGRTDVAPRLAEARRRAGVM